MTTDQVNDPGSQLVTADAEDDPDRFRGAAYRLAAAPGPVEEPGHAHCVAPWVHSLAGGAR